MAALEVTWGESEWADLGSSAYLRGYVADVWAALPGGRSWTWVVKATEAVSEWPEVWSNGTARTEQAAQRQAEVALRRVARQAPAVNPNTGERNAWAGER